MNSSAEFRFIHCCLLVFEHHRPTLKVNLTGLNHFSLATYGLQLPLPTLNLSRYRAKPKAKYEMRSVALFRWHFQPLAIVHFRGAPKIFFITFIAFHLLPPRLIKTARLSSPSCLSCRQPEPLHYLSRFLGLQIILHHKGLGLPRIVYVHMRGFYGSKCSNPQCHVPI